MSSLLALLTVILHACYLNWIQYNLVFLVKYVCADKVLRDFTTRKMG